MKKYDLEPCSCGRANPVSHESNGVYWVFCPKEGNKSHCILNMPHEKRRCVSHRAWNTVSKKEAELRKWNGVFTPKSKWCIISEEAFKALAQHQEDLTAPTVVLKEISTRMYSLKELSSSLTAVDRVHLRRVLLHVEAMMSVVEEKEDQQTVEKENTP